MYVYVSRPLSGLLSSKIFKHAHFAFLINLLVILFRGMCETMSNLITHVLKTITVVLYEILCLLQQIKNPINFILLKFESFRLYM